MQFAGRIIDDEGSGEGAVGEARLEPGMPVVVRTPSAGEDGSVGAKSKGRSGNRASGSLCPGIAFIGGGEDLHP